MAFRATPDRNLIVHFGCHQVNVRMKMIANRIHATALALVTFLISASAAQDKENIAPRHRALLFATLFLCGYGVPFPFLLQGLAKTNAPLFGTHLLLSPLLLLVTIFVLIINTRTALPRGLKIAAILLSIAGAIGYGWIAIPMIMMLIGLAPPVWGQ